MTKGRIKQNTLELKINLSLVGLIVCLFVLYTYFLSASVVHVVMRTQINTQMQQTTTEISQLDAKYMTLQNKVSTDIASLDGYSHVTKKIFLSRADTNTGSNLAYTGGVNFSH